MNSYWKSDVIFNYLRCSKASKHNLILSVLDHFITDAVYEWMYVGEVCDSKTK